MRSIAVVLVSLLVPVLVLAVDPARLDNPDQDARYRKLLDEIRCVVCQNQTLADSNAPLAIDLREEVRLRIEAGATDREVLEYLTARYGDFVLYRPPFNSVTALLWLSPLILLLFGGVFAWRMMTQGRASIITLDEASRARARALLEEREP